MDSNVMHVRNIIRQGGKVYHFVKQWIVYTHSTFLSLFTAQVVNTVQTTQFNIQCSNMCLLDSCNLYHIVIGGLKRKYLHWWGNLSCIGTKPTVPYFLHRWMFNKTWESQVVSAWNWNIGCVCVQSSHYASFNSSNHLACNWNHKLI